MPGPFIHNIDPIFSTLLGIHLWWYGLSYTAGFIGLFFWLKRARMDLGLEPGEIYRLSISIALGVLLGGRLVEVLFYEWSYYGSHIHHIPAIWLGGMSTHGILLGAIIAILIFSRCRNRSFFQIADVLAIAAAYIMGVGRIGNFIDGQIAGSVTAAWWGVKFPDLDGFRHPVVLYDGIKNLLLIPVLLLIRKAKPPRGVVTAHFILWYGFLRIFVDLFRDYRSDFLGFPPGQEFNVLMTVVGIAMLVYFHRTRSRAGSCQATSWVQSPHRRAALRRSRLTFTALLLVPLVIPSDWTQDVPERYGKRHPGLHHSIIYPPLSDNPPATSKPAPASEMTSGTNRKTRLYNAAAGVIVFPSTGDQRAGSATHTEKPAACRYDPFSSAGRDIAPACYVIQAPHSWARYALTSSAFPANTTLSSFLPIW